MNPTTMPLLSVDGLTKVFGGRARTALFQRERQPTRAVTDVSFSINRGEVLGIVGESGSGKTTLARMILRLIEPTRGSVMLHGRNVLGMSSDDVRTHVRPVIRMIFQEPDAVLNPGYTIGFGLTRAILTQPASDSACDVDGQVAKLLTCVGLDASYASKYPDELSGGEKRRVGICRALATNPEIIVADEPLSGLDVVLQERVLELLKSEQAVRGFALILVSHDLDRVNQVCDRVMVMHGGRVVEHVTLRRNEGAIREQYQHPYSILLQSARVDSEGFDAVTHLAEIDVTGDGTTNRPAGVGCSFAPSCARRSVLGDPPVCWTAMPPLEPIATDQSVACHFSGIPVVTDSVRETERGVLLSN